MAVALIEIKIKIMREIMIEKKIDNNEKWKHKTENQASRNSVQSKFNLTQKFLKDWMKQHFNYKGISNSS